MPCGDLPRATLTCSSCLDSRGFGIRSGIAPAALARAPNASASATLRTPDGALVQHLLSGLYLQTLPCFGTLALDKWWEQRWSADRRTPNIAPCAQRHRRSLYPPFFSQRARSSLGRHPTRSRSSSAVIVSGPSGSLLLEDGTWIMRGHLLLENSRGRRDFNV